ncbi:unnamed protein product [Sphagnum balticum]
MGIASGVTDILTTSLLGASKSFDTLKDSSSSMLDLGTQLNQLGNNLQPVLSVLSKFTGFTGVAGTATKDFASKVVEAADNAIHFQQGYFTAAGATGQFGEAIKAAGPGLMNLNKIMLENQLRVTELASATGTLPSKVTEVYKQMGMFVPDALNKTIDATDKYGQKLNAVQAVIQMSAGTGQTSTEVTKNMKQAMENYSASLEQQLEYQARISESSEKTGINYEYMSKAMSSVSDAFAGISDEGPAATAAINSNAQAVAGLSAMFKDSGMSGKASADAAADMMKNLKGMSFASKSFLSSQSGGPGGLQGGFKIEEMMREGKEKEVMQMEMDNLKKHMGGQLVTLKEAAEDNSGRAAAQLAKQNALMKSGAFGNLIGGDDNKAERLAEGMKKGLSIKDIDLGDGQNNAQDKMRRGADLLKTTDTMVNQMNVKADELKIIAGHDALDFLQKNAGATERTDRNTGQQYINDKITSVAKDGATKAAQPMQGITKQLNSLELMGAQAQQPGRAAGAALAVSNQVGQAGRGMMSATAVKQAQTSIGKAGDAPTPRNQTGSVIGATQPAQDYTQNGFIVSPTPGGNPNNLPSQQVPSQRTGSTGSSGIEGINVLYEIYRAEQYAFDIVGLTLASDNAASAAANQIVGGIGSAIGGAVGGSVGAAVGGAIASSLFGTDPSSQALSAKNIPSLAQYAFAVEMFYQGWVYRGFFDSMDIIESAEQLGLFEYNITFFVTERRGYRVNGFPWQKSAIDGPSGPSIPYSFANANF